MTCDAGNGAGTMRGRAWVAELGRAAGERLSSLASLDKEASKDWKASLDKEL